MSGQGCFDVSLVTPEITTFLYRTLRPLARIRIYLPEDERDAPVVICSELPHNSGGSVTYATYRRRFQHSAAREMRDGS